jgi:hypothetical protein
MNEKIFFDALFVGSQQQQQRKIDKHKYTIKFEFARQREGQKNEKELRKHTAHTILYETIYTHRHTRERHSARRRRQRRRKNKNSTKK